MAQFDTGKEKRTVDIALKLGVSRTALAHGENGAGTEEMNAWLYLLTENLWEICLQYQENQRIKLRGGDMRTLINENSQGAKNGASTIP